MKIVSITQGTPEWLAWRKEGITASKAACLLDQDLFQTPHQFWAEFVGLQPGPDLSKVPMVIFGKENEEKIRQAAEQLLNDLILPACGEAAHNPIIRASFDGLTTENAPVELKAPTRKRFQELLDHGEEAETYRHYAPQVIAQNIVADSPGGHLLFWYGYNETIDLPEEVPENLHQIDGKWLLHFEIARDAEKEQELEAAAMEMWRRIQEHDPPEMNPARDVYQPASDHEQKAWQQAERELREALMVEWQVKATLEAAERRRKQIEDRFFDLLGPFTAGEHGGIRASRFSKRGAVDTAKLYAKYSITEDVAEAFRKKGQVQTRVTVRDVSYMK